MPDNLNKAEEIYKYRKNTSGTDSNLQYKQVDLLKSILAAQESKKESDKKFGIFNDLKKEVVKSFTSEQSTKEMLRDTLVDGFRTLDKNIGGFIKSQIPLNASDLRNRFSNSKIGKANETWNRKVNDIEKISEKVTSNVFKTMLVGGVLASIATAVLSTVVFKKFFDSASDEQKNVGRTLKTLALPFIEQMDVMKKMRAEKSIFGMLKTNIKKHGIVSGLLGGALDVKRAKFDAPLSRFRTEVIGDFFNKAKGFGVKGEFIKDSLSGAKGVLNAEMPAAMGDDIAKLGGKAKNLFSAVKNVGNQGVVKTAMSSLMGEVSEIGKIAKSMRVKETMHVLQKAGVVGLSQGGLGLMSKLFTETSAAAGRAAGFVAKGLGKAALKRLPMVGGIFSIMSGVDRWNRGERVQGLIDFASGAINLGIPGAGWPVSMALDMLNMGIDFAKMDPGKASARAGSAGKIFKYAKLGIPFLKKVPGLGLMIGLGLGIKKWQGGDKIGAMLEIASGVASTIPGLGTLVSVGIDLLLLARDFDMFTNPANLSEKQRQKYKEFSKRQLRNMPMIGTYIRIKEGIALWGKGKYAEAFKAGGMALATLVPGFQLIKGLIDAGEMINKDVRSSASTPNMSFATPPTEFASHTPGGMELPTDKDGNVSTDGIIKLDKKYKKNLSKAKKSGNTKDVAKWQAKIADLKASIAARKPTNTTPGIGGGGSTTPSQNIPSVNMPKGSGEKNASNDVHTSVGVSDANMDDVKWNKLGGRAKIEQAILAIWNNNGIVGQPTFTSGHRSKSKNTAIGGTPNSKHLTGMAFDIRGKDIPLDKRAGIAAGLNEAFSNSGHHIYPHGEGDKFHYHVQYPAPGKGSVSEVAEDPSKIDVKDMGMPLAANGLFTNRPAIFGEAGPEFAIPYNDKGIGHLSEALCRAISVGSARSSAPNNAGAEFKQFLLNEFAPALANQIAKVNKAKNVQQSNGLSVQVL